MVQGGCTQREEVGYNTKKEVERQSTHAGHEKRKDRKKEREKRGKKEKRKQKAVCRHLTRLDWTRQVGRQREGGTNQPPLVGSAKQTWPGVEEAYIRSIRMKRKEKGGEREHIHTCTHTTQACELYKPIKLFYYYCH